MNNKSVKLSEMSERNPISIDFDLQRLEERFSRLFGQQQPRSTYVQALREQLKNSRIFELRRSLGRSSSRVLGVICWRTFRQHCCAGTKSPPSAERLGSLFGLVSF
jgi:hypothetical protein